MSEDQSVHVNTLNSAELIERNVMLKATAHRIHSRGVTVPRHPSDGDHEPRPAPLKRLSGTQTQSL